MNARIKIMNYIIIQFQNQDESDSKKKTLTSAEPEPFASPSLILRNGKSYVVLLSNNWTIQAFLIIYKCNFLAISLQIFSYQNLHRYVLCLLIWHNLQTLFIPTIDVTLSLSTLTTLFNYLMNQNVFLIKGHDFRAQPLLNIVKMFI